MSISVFFSNPRIAVAAVNFPRVTIPPPIIPAIRVPKLWIQWRYLVVGRYDSWVRIRMPKVQAVPTEIWSSRLRVEDEEVKEEEEAMGGVQL